MPSQFQTAPEQTEELLGDVGLLAQQLGSPENLVAAGSLSLVLGFPHVVDAASLGKFLDAYRAQILVALELPAIIRAYQHASRYEGRELIALDAEIGTAPMMREFASASLQVGRNQLRRLRPLRDQKVVQRYLEATDAGRAKGWHTLVYGLMLAVYSIPPREGLLAYGKQTLGSFAHSAARNLGISQVEFASIVDNACASLPIAINSLVDTAPNPFLAAASATQAALPT